jgi:cytoskeletal protein CcmA (bactofilin family)
VSIDSSAEVSGVIRFFKLAINPGAVITGELVTMAQALDPASTESAESKEQ